MQEIDFNSVANEFGIRKEDGVALAQRLKDFLGAQAIGWREHQKKMDLPKQDERYAIEFKRWRDYLGMVAPRDLPNHGVGQTFLVAWNCDGGSTSGGERTPMTIWLAKGKYLQVEAKTNQLAVVFLQCW